MAHDQGCLVCNCGFRGFSVCGALEKERERERGVGASCCSV